MYYLGQFTLLLLVGWVSAKLKFSRAVVFTLLVLAASLVLSHLHPPIFRGYYEGLLIAYLPPFVALAILVITGREKSKLDAGLAELQASLDIGRSEFEEVMDELVQTREIKDLLETKIYKGEDHVYRLQEAISGLASLDFIELKPRLLELVRDFCNAKSVSYYTFESRSLKLEEALNPPEDLVHSYGERDSVFQLLADHPEVLSPRELEAGRFPGMRVACRLATDSGKVLGAMIIHEIDFLDLNLPNLKLFEMLCNWSAVEIEKVLGFERQQYQMIKLHNFRYFLQLLFRETLKVHRTQDYSCILTLMILDVRNLRTGRLEEVLGLVSGMINVIFPGASSVFFNELVGDRFHVILGNMDEKEALLKKDQFINLVSEMEMRPYFQPGKPIDISGEFFFLTQQTDENELDRYIQEQSTGVDGS
ncbi:hypothetical protein HOF92_11120 [bacterium]|nr:hypothetical protein [bacterium]